MEVLCVFYTVEISSRCMETLGAAIDRDDGMQFEFVFYDAHCVMFFSKLQLTTNGFYGSGQQKKSSQESENML